MTVLLATGFEHGVNPLTAAGGGLASLVTGSPTVNAISKYSGGYGLECNTTSPTTAYFTQTFPAQNKLGIAFRIKVVTSATSANFLLRLEGSSTYVYFALRDNSIGTFAIFNGVAYTNWAAYVTGSWYEIQLVFDGPGMTIDGWINGVPQPRVTYANPNTYNNINLGSISGVTQDLYIDDLVVTDGAAPFPLPSDYRVDALLPVSDGAHNAGAVIKNQAGTVIDGTTAPAWSLVDEVPQTAIADFVEQTAIGAANYAEVNFADTGLLTIYGVQGVLAQHSSAAVANAAETRIHRSDGDATLYAGDMNAASLAYRSAAITPPAGGWTPAAVNALTGRLGYASNVGSIPYWDALLLEVAGSPTGAAPGSPSRRKRGKLKPI